MLLKAKLSLAYSKYANDTMTTMEENKESTPGTMYTTDYSYGHQNQQLGLQNGYGNNFHSDHTPYVQSSYSGPRSSYYGPPEQPSYPSPRRPSYDSGTHVLEPYGQQVYGDDMGPTYRHRRITHGPVRPIAQSQHGQKSCDTDGHYEDDSGTIIPSSRRRNATKAKTAKQSAAKSTMVDKDKTLRKDEDEFKAEDDDTSDNESVYVDPEDALFVPKKVDKLRQSATHGAARRLKNSYEHERRSNEGKRRRGGKSSGAPIPAVSTFNPTNVKIAYALKKVREEAGVVEPKAEEDDDEGSSTVGHEKRWETHVQPYIDEESEQVRKTGRTSRDGKGAEDPENVEIVRLFDTYNDFKIVCKMINDARIAKGKKPHFKPNNINCRYNRAAPDIWALQGRKFIRVADRVIGSKGQAAGHKHTREEQKLAGWTDELDTSLVEFEHEYDERKWTYIAEQLRAKHPDSEVPSFPDANACGYRFMNLP